MGEDTAASKRVKAKGLRPRVIQEAEHLAIRELCTYSLLVLYSMP